MAAPTSTTSWTSRARRPTWKPPSAPTSASAATTQRSSWNEPEEPHGRTRERIRGATGPTRAGRRWRLRPPARHEDALCIPNVHGGRPCGPLDPNGDDRRLLLPAYGQA